MPRSGCTGGSTGHVPLYQAAPEPRPPGAKTPGDTTGTGRGQHLRAPLPVQEQLLHSDHITRRKVSKRSYYQTEWLQGADTLWPQFLRSQEKASGQRETSAALAKTPCCGQTRSGQDYSLWLAMRSGSVWAHPFEWNGKGSRCISWVMLAGSEDILYQSWRLVKKRMPYCTMSLQPRGSCEPALPAHISCGAKCAPTVSSQTCAQCTRALKRCDSKALNINFAWGLFFHNQSSLKSDRVHCDTATMPHLQWSAFKWYFACRDNHQYV